MMNILCIGDIVGKPGREAVGALLTGLKEEFDLDCVIANAENSAAGAGLTSRIAKELFERGCDVLTLGDHTWDQKELEPFLKECPDLIRPANFPSGAPGHGWCMKTTTAGPKVAVINLLGRVFMRFAVECPFRALDAILTETRKETPIVIVDFHAETTSEKIAFGHFADGKVSAVFGTHTHIQTADDKILPQGTAYITDLGMTGPYDSVIGQDKTAILERFLTSRPIKFKVAEGEILLCGIILKVNETTGKTEEIRRIQRALKKNSANTG